MSSSPISASVALRLIVPVVLALACGDGSSSSNETSVDPVMCGCAVPVCDYEDGQCRTDAYEGPECTFDALHDFLFECPSEPTSPCGLVEEFCFQDTSTYDCVLSESDEWLRYTEAGLECALTQLRDRTPGALALQSTRDYNITGTRRVLQITAQGEVIDHNCTYADLSSTLFRPTTVELSPPKHFEGCLAQVDPKARWECLHAGITEVETLPLCAL